MRWVDVRAEPLRRRRSRSGPSRSMTMRRAPGPANPGSKSPPAPSRKEV